MAEDATPKARVETSGSSILLWGSRRIVGSASIAAWLIFAFAFCVSFISGVGFVSYLILAFLTFLSAMHAHYALTQDLTQRKARTIDYWYLGTAVLGLLVFAAGYSNQREGILSRMLNQAREQTLREMVMQSFAYDIKFLCDTNMILASRKPCENTKNILKEVRPNLSAEQIDALKKRFDDEVRAVYKKLVVNGPTGGLDVYSTGTTILRLEDWANYRRTAPTQTGAKRDETFEILFGLGQFVIWPFILAYALALRITKVTIDVFEWAK